MNPASLLCRPELLLFLGTGLALIHFSTIVNAGFAIGSLGPPAQKTCVSDQIRTSPGHRRARTIV
jgi:hypothetical protein